MASPFDSIIRQSLLQNSRFVKYYLKSFVNVELHCLPLCVHICIFGGDRKGRTNSPLLTPFLYNRFKVVLLILYPVDD